MLSKEKFENIKIKKKKAGLRNEKGSITLFVLIAMLFFIITLLSMFVSNNNKMQAQVAEIEKIEENYKYTDDDVENIYNQNFSDNLISKNENYVGYYADLDGEGTPDGIIYADLKAGMRGDGNWTNSSDNYTIPKESNVKDYCIIKNEYNGKFGNKPVIALKGGTGEERFYVMALEDLDNNVHYWYYNVYKNGMSDYSSTTFEYFGSGKQNTETMIKKYEDKAYGEPYTEGAYTDLWGLNSLKQKVSEGWFVPSKEEWAAFGGEIAEIVGITADDYNFKDFGLRSYYWSSSQGNTSNAWSAAFAGCFMYNTTVFNDYCVRLSATF